MCETYLSSPASKTDGSAVGISVTDTVHWEEDEGFFSTSSLGASPSPDSSLPTRLHTSPTAGCGWLAPSCPLPLGREQSYQHPVRETFIPADP